MIFDNERIFSYGGTGCGKSDAWLSIAEANPDSIFYCIDTDKSVKRLLSTDYTNVKNVKLTLCRDWDTFETVVNRLEEVIKNTPQDWIVIDSIDNLWSFVINWYCLKVFGKEYDEYLLQLRQAIGTRDVKKLESLKGWTDWNVLNPTYQSLVNKVAIEFDCNHYWTARTKEYTTTDAEKEESVELATQFTNLGFRPDGEKRNAYRMHSVFYLRNDGDSYYIHTIKDRGRKKLKHFKYSTDNKKQKFFELYQHIINKEEVKEVE